jgi:hypothetical protein
MFFDEMEKYDRAKAIDSKFAKAIHASGVFRKPRRRLTPVLDNPLKKERTAGMVLGINRDNLNRAQTARKAERERKAQQ